MAPRKPGLGFIIVTLFLDILGIGLVIPILPRLVLSFVPSSDTALASGYNGVFMATYALMQFVFSPALGVLSDRFGRRPVLLISMVGQMAGYLLLAGSTGLWWLLAGRVVAGIAGASVGPATAYIADVTPPEKRAQSFGLIGMAFGLGFIAGPFLGGTLGKISLHLPFYCAAGLAVANALYGLFLLPESLSSEHRRPVSWARANPLGALRSLSQYPLVLALGASIFFVSLAQRGMETVWVLYAGHRFGWDVQVTSYSLALVGLTTAVVQGGLVRRAIPVLGERRAILVGLGVAITAFTLYGLANQGWMMFAVIPLGSLAGLAPPALQGVLSRAVPMSEQGLLQGGMLSLNSVTMVLGPLVSNLSFGRFIQESAPLHLPGVPFFLSAGFAAVGLWLALRAFSANPEAHPPQAPQAG